MGCNCNKKQNDFKQQLNDTLNLQKNNQNIENSTIINEKLTLRQQRILKRQILQMRKQKKEST